MYVAQQQGYTAPPTQDDAESISPAEPQPQVGATEGFADNRVAGPAQETQGTTVSNVDSAQAVAGNVDPFTVGLGVPGVMDPWQLHHVAQAAAAQAQAAGLQTAPVEELQATAGADPNEGMFQTPGRGPNTLFPESAAPNSPQHRQRSGIGIVEGSSNG